ncbi:MAG TPA: methylmalonyl Co-A mutase-associated GTPase MeaB [Syntrophales bacterium]|nr:methylmalonyl Co-A mutase-associated GTPase MeaB [Syntrophales bacterium]
MTINYADDILRGIPLAVARVITWLENEDERARPTMEEIYPHTGSAYIVGITGSPGTGKSTLTDGVTWQMRQRNLTVGIIAVDPSSPFTGGALLGDRIRMTRHSEDPGVFVRSMATRGALGGLAQFTQGATKVLDASGKDVVIIETVGVGQDEVDIMRVADTTCVVLVPGLGDVIQSMKAGIMEIADIYVVNKSDQPGSDQLYSEVMYRVDQDVHMKGRKWVPPVIKTIAVEGKGEEELLDAIMTHHKYLVNSGDLLVKRRERTRQETLQMIHHELFCQIQARLCEDNQIEKMVEAIMDRKLNPYNVVEQVVSKWLPSLKKT